MTDDIETKVNKLLADPGFLELVHFRNRPNLFSTLAASHTEMWHSAFVTWLIDPASHLGLGTVCTLKAKDRRSGTPVSITGSVMVRIVDEKLTEAYNHWDFLGLFGQLGLLPSASFEKALSGQKVA